MGGITNFVSRADVVQLLRETYFDGMRRCEADLRQFVGPLYDWADRFLQRPLPDNWRDVMHAYLDEQEPRGYEVLPEHRPPLEEWLYDWATYRGLLPAAEAQVARVPLAPPVLEVAAPAPVTRLADSTAVPKPPAARPTKLPAKYWPRLTEKERDRAQKETELPEWYPFQPRNRMDSLWELKFEDYGRTARDRLLAFFNELSAFGRMSIAMGKANDADLDQLTAQRDRVQQGYDGFLEARIVLAQEWTRYLETETLVGPNVMALVHKIDAALPTRVAGLESAYDAKLEAARKAIHRASDAALKRAEGLYTAIVWTDRVITAVEWITLGATISKGATKVFTEVAKASGRWAAAKATATYVTTQLATAAASVVAASVVVPEVLSYAGLDETEVQVGLAAFGAIGIVSTLSARPVSSRAAKRASGADSKGTDAGARNKEGGQRPRDSAGPASWDETHPLIEGTTDRPRSPAHVFLQETIADEMRMSGYYVRVSKRQSLSKFSGVKIRPDIEPDNIGLTVDGKIDIVEIKSPGQPRGRLEKKLEDAWNQLPPEMRGEFRVVDPADASR